MYFYKLIQAKLYFPPARGHAELNLDKYLLRIALIFQVLYREGNLLELVHLKIFKAGGHFQSGFEKT